MEVFDQIAQQVQDALEAAPLLLQRLIIGLVVFAIGYLVTRLVQHGVVRAVRRTPGGVTVEHAVSRVIAIVGITLSFLTALATQGARAVAFPTIALRPADDPGPLDRAIGRLGTYAWIVFTSANAVRFFAERLGDRPLPSGIRVAAVGTGTAAAAGERGLRVDAMPDEFVGARIAAALGRLDGRAVLLPRADLAGAETPATLRAAPTKPRTVPEYPLEPVSAPEFRVQSADPTSWIEPTGKPLEFRTTGQRNDVTLVPLHSLFDERYAVYWRVTRDAQGG